MLSTSQNRAVLHTATHERRLTEPLPSGTLLSSKRGERHCRIVHGVFHCLSLALTITSLARTIQMAHLTSWGWGTWEAYLIKNYCPRHTQVVQRHQQLEKWRDCQQGASNLVKEKHYNNTRFMTNTFLQSLHLERPGNRATIICRELPAARLDLDTSLPSRLCSNLGKKCSNLV